MARFFPFAITLLVLHAAVRAQDPLSLEQKPSSPQARNYRGRAAKRWAQARPIWEKLQRREEVTAQEAGLAVEAIERAVLDYERSLSIEWNPGANRDLADCARAWYRLRVLLPPPAEPADEDARKRADAAASKEKRELLRRARRFVMDLTKARRYENLYGRCPHCEGRKVIRRPFGGEESCPVCSKRGVLVQRKGVLAARWLSKSPLYRADGRNASRVDRLLHAASRQPALLEPFVRSASVTGEIEDHDTWVRVRTRERIYRKPGARQTERVDAEYVLLRVGRQWYLYTARYDRALIEIPGAGE